jgi:hypothetical protein
VVAFLQALLTPIIAVLTVVIAVAQYRLAKAKLILPLLTWPCAKVQNWHFLPPDWHRKFLVDNSNTSGFVPGPFPMPKDFFARLHDYYSAVGKVLRV